MTGESLSFDRAAEFYDKTRSLAPETMAQVIPMLARELSGRTIEIGVGTGRIAVPLADAGLEIVGIDISRKMLNKLREKDDRGSIPVAAADACALPFSDDTFSAAIASHVLHLIPEWKRALDELVRVLRPGGRILVSVAGEGTGPWEEIWRKMREFLGDKATRPGADRLADIDGSLGSKATRITELPRVMDRRPIKPDEFIDMLGRGWFSFTWSLSEEELRRATDEVRQWAAERFGDLEREIENRYEVVWKAYDLP